MKFRDGMENEVKEYLKHLEMQKQEIEQQVKMQESGNREKRNTFESKHKRSNHAAK